MTTLWHKIVNKCWQYARETSERYQLQRMRSLPNVTIHETAIMGTNSELHIETSFAVMNIGAHFFTRNGCQIRVGDKGQLVIGQNVFWNNGCSINCMCEVVIGNNVMFGEGVKIYDHNHNVIQQHPLQIQREQLKYGKVEIGDNCWLGSNVIVLRGVTIGANCVIGAGCVIHKDIPANSIVRTGTNCEIIQV